ncbi:MAG: hypothetical protein R3C56_43365 [Pirellulaceae bacterium]
MSWSIALEPLVARALHPTSAGLNANLALIIYQHIQHIVAGKAVGLAIKRANFLWEFLSLSAMGSADEICAAAGEHHEKDE